MSVFAPFLNFIWESAREYGIDPEQLFRDAGVDPEIRHDQNARFDADQLDQLIWATNQESDDDAFAFHLVEHMHPSYFGVIGYAWMTSASLRKGFERVYRYQRLLTDEGSITLEKQGENLKVLLEWQTGCERDPALRERVRLTNVVKLCRMNCGDAFKPEKIFFMQAEPSRPAAYYTYFRCELEFGAESTAMLINAETVDRPLPGYNPQLEQILEKQIIDYLAKLDKNDIIGRTKSMICDLLPSGHVSVEEIADKLCLSERTLRRRLKDSDSSFKELLAETRRELGERYIQDSSLSLTEVAFMLGFSDSSSLSRAYKNWTGKSPSEYRSSHQGSQTTS